RRHHHVVGEGAVAGDPDADRVRAQVLLAGAAVAAVAADQVALGGNPLADLVARHARAERGDAADELMADHQAGLDRALAPLVPQVDVQVGAADRRLLHPDQRLVGAGRGDGDFFHPHALGGVALDQRAHGGGDLAGLAHRAVFHLRTGRRLYAAGPPGCPLAARSGRRAGVNSPAVAPT